MGNHQGGGSVLLAHHREEDRGVHLQDEDEV